MVYDLWGEAVNLAFRVQSEHPEAGIYLTDRVAAGLPATVPLVVVGTVELSTGSQRILRLDMSRDHD
jgi:class 3 adenylate cyclase